MKNSQGLTLVELIIVLIIIVILGSVAIPIYRSYIHKAQFVRNEIVIKQSKNYFRLSNANKKYASQIQERCKV
ncbi:MAG: prepilin-type N-terminal cleavage/methylation domain-containing protein [Endomicrobium sp.]|jgi:prepilin-type N-terminal cleavage/methylation domain-containing protein|nr:prepilin-type N-terminal cleavage/methylation domain-containing protein [Endomicrobium sp.]